MIFAILTHNMTVANTLLEMNAAVPNQLSVGNRIIRLQAPLSTVNHRQQKNCAAIASPQETWKSFAYLA